MSYWNWRDELRAKAQEHTDKMEREYLGEITQAYRASEIFDFHNVSKHEKVGEPEYTLLKKDSVTALFTQPKGRWCVLNFASYKKPGSKFIDGSFAQEESLCHASFLYNVLRQETDYYEWNNAHKNRGMYENRAIYTPNVRFFQEHYYRDADVLTCAAPNRGFKMRRFSDEENDMALRQRINFIANILKSKEKDLNGAILGAFGCGLFAQDAERVATLFKASPLPTSLKIVYAIPGENYQKFAKVFGGCTEQETQSF